jgi:hypothetical protein
MRLTILLLLTALLPAPALAKTATGYIRVHAFEVDTPTGVVALGQQIDIQRSSHHRMRVAPDSRLISGAKMRVRGTLTADGTLVADPSDRGVKLLRSTIATPAYAQERLLVIPVSFPDLPMQATATTIATHYPRLSDWIARASYGRTTLAVDLIDVRTSDVPLSSVACDFSGAMALAVRLAASRVADFRHYTIINLVIPDLDWSLYNCTGFQGAGGAIIGRWPLTPPTARLSSGNKSPARVLRRPCTRPGIPSVSTTPTDSTAGLRVACLSTPSGVARIASTATLSTTWDKPLAISTPLTSCS